jgi:hypothetical protein
MANKLPNKTLETIILGLIIIIIFLKARETGEQVTSSCVRSIVKVTRNGIAINLRFREVQFDHYSAKQLITLDTSLVEV